MSESNDSVFNFPKFSGAKADFPVFSVIVLAIAANATHLHDQGLLGLLLPQANFDIMFPPVGVPPVRQYTPVMNPGPFDAAWLGNHPLIPAADQRTVWKEQQTDYRSILRLQNKFNSALIGSLDPSTLQRISDPITGLANLDIAQLWAAVVADRGTVTPGDLRDVDIETLRVFNPSDPTVNMRSHISTHRRAHLMYAAAGCPKTEYTKTEEFVASFRHLPLFADRLRTWMALNPTIAGQTFGAVTIIMEQFEDAVKRLPVSTPQLNTLLRQFQLLLARLTDVLDEVLVAQPLLLLVVFHSFPPYLTAGRMASVATQVLLARARQLATLMLPPAPIFTAATPSSGLSNKATTRLHLPDNLRAERKHCLMNHCLMLRLQNVN
jgi:hypothetical protein